MKIENLQEVNNLNAELKENKAKLKIIENECIKLDYMRLIFHILKSIKKIKEQLKELGVEVDE